LEILTGDPVRTLIMTVYILLTILYDQNLEPESIIYTNIYKLCSKLHKVIYLKLKREKEQIQITKLIKCVVVVQAV
jgi:hypothetical protein